MKRLISALLLLTILISSCKKEEDDAMPPPTDLLTTGWTKQTVGAGDATFVDVFFISNTGFAASDKGLYKSTDGGTNWSLASSIYFENIGMGSTSNAIFVQFPDKLVYTNDAGATFNTVAIADQGLKDVFFVNATTAYAAGQAIWKTSNGGQNWTKLYDFGGNPMGYKALHFIDDQFGWVTREGGIYKTVNNGTTWQPVNTGSGYDLSQGGYVFFLDINNGYMSDNQSISKTTNAGAAWSKLQQGLAHGYHDIHFINTATGYFADYSFIYKTTDAGVSWSKVVSLADRGISEVHFTDVNHGWACGGNGTLLKYVQ
jgi:photosystem II stability/assembly factor-like uncharacterized protein